MPLSWSERISGPTGKCLWLRGIVPSSLVKSPPWQVQDVCEVTCTGWWREGVLNIPPGFIVAVGASTGPSRDPRCRCAVFVLHIFEIIPGQNPKVEAFW